MYIYPNTDIYILRNVSLNNDYDHTIYFSSEQQQRTFFNNDLRVKFRLSNQQYQRKERGWLQINVNQNQLLDCTYLMFKNNTYTINPTTEGTSYKWFYAFILDIEYVNEGTSLIRFEIDVMQTWFFDYQLDKCYVEREHTETDNLFENLVDENLDLGTDYNVQISDDFDLTCTTLVLLTVDNFSHSLDLYTGFIGNYYYPLNISVYDLTDSHSRDSLLYYIDLIKQEGQQDAIVSMYQVPGFLAFPKWRTGEDIYTTVDKKFNGIAGANFVNIDGYVPKNKKLFNYPYNFLSVTNREGNEAEYKWELWDRDHIGEFSVTGTMLGKPACIMYPRYYRDIPSDYETGIIAVNFPQNPWSGDAWQLFWAQHGESYKVAQEIAYMNAGYKFMTSRNIGSVYRNAQTTFVNGLSQRPLSQSAETMIRSRELGAYASEGSAVLDVIATVKQDLAFQKDLQHMPNQAYGQANADILNQLTDNKKFCMFQMTIKNSFAKIIDEYFSRYGYACHRIKIPNRNARQNWTYTKTIGCEIVGNLPNNVINQIKAIYDKGITFWNDGMNIGYYGDFTNPVYS